MFKRGGSPSRGAFTGMGAESGVSGSGGVDELRHDVLNDVSKGLLLRQEVILRQMREFRQQPQDGMS